MSFARRVRRMERGLGPPGLCRCRDGGMVFWCPEKGLRPDPRCPACGRERRLAVVVFTSRPIARERQEAAA